MTPRDILLRLGREGVKLEPKLTVIADHQPTPETLKLVTLYRDDILRYLLTHQHGLIINMCRQSEKIFIGATWCNRCFRYQQNPCSPTSKIYGEEAA